MAQLTVPMRENRDPLAVTLLESRLFIHINDVQLEVEVPPQCAQGCDHFLAKVAIAATVDRQRARVSSSRRGTGHRVSWAHAG